MNNTTANKVITTDQTGLLRKRRKIKKVFGDMSL